MCLYFPVLGPFLGPRSWPWLSVPVPGLQFMFTDPGPRFVFTGTVPQFSFTSPGSQFVFPDPGLQFYYQSRDWIYTYQHFPLNLYLHLLPLPTICITGPGPEFAFTLLLVVVTVVVVTAEVVISLEQIIQYLYADFSKLGKTHWSAYVHRMLRRFSVEPNEYVLSF